VCVRLAAENDSGTTQPAPTPESGATTSESRKPCGLRASVLSICPPVTAGQVSFGTESGLSWPNSSSSQGWYAGSNPSGGAIKIKHLTSLLWPSLPCGNLVGIKRR